MGIIRAQSKGMISWCLAYFCFHAQRELFNAVNKLSIGWVRRNEKYFENFHKIKDVFKSSAEKEAKISFFISCNIKQENSKLAYASVKFVADKQTAEKIKTQNQKQALYPSFFIPLKLPFYEIFYFA